MDNQFKLELEARHYKDEYLKYIHSRAKADLGKQLVELTGDIKTRYLPQADPRLVTIEYTI